MTVHLKVFANLAARLSETIADQWARGLEPGKAVELSLPEGTSVEELLERLGLRGKRGLLVFVHGRRVNPEQALHEGAQVGIFPPIGGG